MAAEIELDRARLTERLAPAGVQDLEPLSGGASSLTYAGTRAGGRRVVVKVAPAGVAPVRNRDVLRHARVLRALAPTAVPVPAVLWEDAGDPPDVPPLFVMTFVEGVSLEPLFDPHRDDDEQTVAARMCDAARTMAALHALDPGAVGLSGEPAVGLPDEVARWCRVLETVDPSLAPGWPAVADALQAARPAPGPSAIVHGDFRLGNTIAVGSRIAAVVDWEIWSVGDPRVDLGWFLANADPATYERPSRYRGALPAPAELAGFYAEALGRDVTDVAWFRALACFKSVATWSLIVKHNRRRAEPDPDVDAMAAALPRLLDLAREHLG